MEEIKKRCAFLIIALISLLVGFMITPARAQEIEPILHLQLLIVGPKLTVKQDTLALPRNIPTVLNTEIALPIEVIDEILISKVTSRPLTLEEIREMGIVLSPDSFDAYEFTAVFALQAGEPIEI